MLTKIFKLILLATLIFIGVGAIYGGSLLIIEPSGDLLKIPINILEGSPFHDYLIPGIFLFTVIGLGSLFVFFVLIRKPQWKFFEKFNVFKKQHFSLTYSIYLGIVLILWIGIQVYIIKQFNQLHIQVLVSAILLIVIPQINFIKQHYQQLNA